VLPPPAPPTSRAAGARPRAAGGPPPAGIVAGNATGNGGSTAPAGRDYARDASTAPPPLAGDLSDGTPRRRPSRALLLGGLALLLLALGAGGYLLWNRGRDPRTLAKGIGAYRDGRRDAARTAFERTIAERPNLAAPRVYLARLAREDGDVARATALLDTGHPARHDQRRGVPRDGPAAAGRRAAAAGRELLQAGDRAQRDR
jgi:hypothetical protein